MEACQNGEHGAQAPPFLIRMKSTIFFISRLFNKNMFK